MGYRVAYASAGVYQIIGYQRSVIHLTGGVLGLHGLSQRNQIADSPHGYSHSAYGAGVSETRHDWVCLGVLSGGSCGGVNLSMSDAERLHEVLYDTEASEDVFHYMQDMVKRHGIALFNSVDTNNGITADCFNGRKLTGGKRKKYRRRSSFSQVRYFVRILVRRSSKRGIR